MNSWLEKEEAAKRLCEIAAANGGVDAGLQQDENFRMLAGLLIEEMAGWCGLERIPEGALWVTADELVRRYRSAFDGSIAQVQMGNFSVQYQSGSDQRWHAALRPWRKVRFI